MRAPLLPYSISVLIRSSGKKKTAIERVCTRAHTAYAQVRRAQTYEYTVDMTQHFRFQLSFSNSAHILSLTSSSYCDITTTFCKYVRSASFLSLTLSSSSSSLLTINMVMLEYIYSLLTIIIVTQHGISLVSTLVLIGRGLLLLVIAVVHKRIHDAWRHAALLRS